MARVLKSHPLEKQFRIGHKDFSLCKRKIGQMPQKMVDLIMCLPYEVCCSSTMQLHCQAISDTLEQTKLSLNEYLQDSESLNSHISHLQQEQATLLADKIHAMKQNTQLGCTVSELQQTVQELEATRDQLEADKYAAQTGLEKLQQDHHQVGIPLCGREEVTGEEVTGEVAGMGNGRVFGGVRRKGEVGGMFCLKNTWNNNLVPNSKRHALTCVFFSMYGVCIGAIHWYVCVDVCIVCGIECVWYRVCVVCVCDYRIP